MVGSVSISLNCPDKPSAELVPLKQWQQLSYYIVATYTQHPTLSPDKLTVCGSVFLDVMLKARSLDRRFCPKVSDPNIPSELDIARDNAQCHQDCRHSPKIL